MKQQSKVPSTLLVLHSAVFLFGLSALFGKFLALPVFVIVFIRASLAAMVLGSIRLLQQQTITVDRRNLKGLTLSGLFLAVHWLTFFYSIQLSSVAIGLLAYASFPLFVLLIEVLCFRTRITIYQVVTALTVFVGICMIAPDLSLSSNLGNGMLWGLLSGLSFAALTINNRRQASPRSPDFVAYGQNAIAAFLLFPFAVATWRTPSAVDCAFLGGLGVLCTAVAHTLYIRALRTTTAQAASVAACLEVVYGVLFAYILLDEIPSFPMLMGGLLIVSANLATGLVTDEKVN